MNFIRHLLNAFERIDKEPGLKTYHISLYICLFRIWNKNKFKNPITINRKNIMELSKIGSSNTYAKALKELELYGFIRYHPSFDSGQGSKVHLFTFDTGTNIESEAASVLPEILNGEYLNKIDSTLSAERINNTNLKNEVMNSKKQNAFQVPPLEHIQIYFEQKGYQKIEGEKFFNYYESNGWLVGGKSKMKDWKAAARNWMLNSNKYQSSGPENMQASKIKDNSQRKQFSGSNYQEPL